MILSGIILYESRLQRLFLNKLWDVRFGAFDA